MNLENIKNKIIWFFRSFIWIVPLTIILDQVTKLVVENNNVTNLAIIDGFFYISLTYNTGVAWSFFSGDDMTVIFGILSLLAGIIMIMYFIFRYKRMMLGNRIALLLIIGGCFGNMIDRLFYEQGVIDFLSFHFGSYIFPTFNLADAFLVIGVIILIIIMVLEEFSSNKKKKNELKHAKEYLDEANNKQEEQEENEEDDISYYDRIDDITSDDEEDI